jgi:uncharacterized coiled-coil protein SlyX|tara:strand:- start:53 stop:367 length:315 start_codon:yes stop_codon:yes gene_type:complete
MNFLEIYGEAGMIGVVGAMFVYLVVQMSSKAAKQQETLEDLKVENRAQSETLENIESMIIKLIDRWNSSDSTTLRHREDVIREISELSEKVAEVRGSLSRMNGR